MKTKIRKLGTKKYKNIQHDDGECVFCAACRHVANSGIIYLEDETGVVHKCKIIYLVSDGKGPFAVACEIISRQQAIAEISVGAS